MLLEECEVRHSKEFVDEKKRLEQAAKNDDDAVTEEEEKEDKVEHEIFEVITSSKNKRSVCM